MADRFILQFSAALSGCDGFTIRNDVEGAAEPVVCECWPCAITDRSEIIRYQNLLVAAPELLAACQAVADECRATFVDTRDMSPEWQAILVGLDKAIAKAKGA